jgi:hypothetical protein
VAGKSDPRSEASKMADFSIIWGVLAGIAYVGAINFVVDLIKANNKNVTSASPAKAIMSLAAKDLTNLPQQLVSAALIAIPIAIVAVLALGVWSHIRPGATLPSALLLVAALAGLAGAGLLFYDLVATVDTRDQFIAAFATIVGVWVLLRLEKYIRRFHKRNPAASSLLLTLLVLIYLILANGSNIAAIVMNQINIWLSLIAFALLLYSSIRLVRLSRKL